MNAVNNVGFNNVENLIGSICQLITPLEQYKIPESIALIKDLGIFFGFGDSDSALVKSIDEMKQLLNKVDKSLDEIKQNIASFEKDMNNFLRTLSHEMQELYSLIDFKNSTDRINNLFTDLNVKTNKFYSDLRELTYQTDSPSSLYNNADDFFSEIYSAKNKTYLEAIRSLVSEIKEDQSMFPKDLIGISYYKYLKTFAAKQNSNSLYVHSMYLQFELRVVHSIATMVYICCAAIKFQLYNLQNNKKLEDQYKQDYVHMHTALNDAIKAIQEQRKINYQSDMPDDLRDMKNTDDYIYFYSFGNSLKWEINSKATPRINFSKNVPVYNRDILYMNLGESQKIACYENEFVIQKPEWLNRNPEVALIDSYGNVVALAPGITEIKIKHFEDKQPYVITVVVESDSRVTVEQLKPVNGNDIFHYKAGQTFCLSSLLKNYDLKINDIWHSSRPECVYIDDEKIVIEPIMASIICIISGYANLKEEKDNKKIFCYFIIQVEGCTPGDQLQLFCPEDYDHIVGDLKCKELLLKNDLDLRYQYYSKYLFSSINFMLNGGGHSLNIFKYTFAKDITKNGCVMNLTLTGCDAERECGVASINAGKIIKVQNHLNIAGESNSGGICLKNAGTIISCENFGDIQNIHVDPRKNTGGICCTNIGTIQQSMNHGNILNGGFIGGICAMNNGTLTYCHNDGNLNTSNANHYLKIASICIYISGYMKDCSCSGYVYYPSMQAGQQAAAILFGVGPSNPEGCSCSTKGPDGQELSLFVKLIS